jgi:polyhydroxybutyrate depolymerase
MRMRLATCLLVGVTLVHTGCDEGDEETLGGGASGGGSAGMGGSEGGQGGGEAGSGQGGDGGSGGTVGTDGCGVALAEPTEEWVAKTIDVGGVTRDYFVYLPPGYDAERRYTVVYQFHGCSGDPNRENNNVPVQDASAGDAIVVRGRAVENCWDTSQDGPDVAFFDAMVGAIEGAYCADPERRMAAGYSSGSFMTHLLACSRGAELRGVASIAGGQTGSNCTGDVAALLIHDIGDPTVNISASVGARDQYLAANGCGDTTEAFEPAPCLSYQGCEAGLPVVWCETTGQGHGRQDGLAAPAFWNFFSSL